MLEDRTYEAGGQPLTDGDTRSATNGSLYSLSIVDGAWTALYEPVLASVYLGTSGASVTLSRAEDGSYSLADGTMVASFTSAPDGTPMGALAENGNRYSLSMVDGEWMAMFDAPAPVVVKLGTSGDSVSIQMEEDRSHWLDGAVIADGHSTTAQNGNEYLLSTTNGEWTASYIPSEQVVTLGMSGTVITLVKAEDRSYRLGDREIADGSTTLSEDGNTYALSMGTDGAWTAIWVQDDPVVHMLGTSGAAISLQRLEDRSWVLGGATGILSLSADDATGMVRVTALNGNAYHLMLTAGERGEAVFQAPAPEIVALGASGESVSIQRAEDGSFRYGGTTVSSGWSVTSSDGRAYTLTYAAGAWTASYDPTTIPVALGNSGQEATLVKAEDGKYWLGDDLVVANETTTMASDGRVYRLTMGEDGMWMATYVPATQTFPAGSSGLDMTVVQDEAGHWSFTHPLTGEPVAIENSMKFEIGTSTYMVSIGEDGMWTATYVARAVPVVLGTSGETVTLMVAEDRTYRLGTALVVSGETTAISSVGVRYTLSMGEDGTWTATPAGNRVTVRLGSFGVATLVLAEDGSWWHRSEVLTDGSLIRAANGNMYRLSMDDGGTWTATYVPMEMEVIGTWLVALANEGGTGYTVDGASLPMSGMGNITTSDGAMYRVHMENGMLHGARYDVAMQPGTARARGFAIPWLSEDAYRTPANEARTMLNVNGEDFSVARLLGLGMSGKAGANIVAEVLDSVTKLRAQARAYEAVNQQLDNKATYDANIVALWTGDTGAGQDTLQGYINRIFGLDGADPVVDLHSTTDSTTSAAGALENFDRLVAALSSLDAFVAATAEDGDGILARAAKSADDAMELFDAAESKSTAYFRTTMNTRYGAYWQKVRPNRRANETLTFLDASGTDSDIGDHGAFSWGLIPGEIRRSHLPPSGSMHYTGGTLAVGTGGAHDSPVVYEGVMDVHLNLTLSTISAVVSDLRDMDGNPLVVNFAELDTISLPSVHPIPASLAWNGTINAAGTNGLQVGASSVDAATNPARVYYRDALGSSTTTTSMQGAWRGVVLGAGARLATAVVGDWWIAEPSANDLDVLTGSFGVEGVEGPPRPAPPLPALSEAKTTVFATGAQASITDAGELRLTLDPANDTNPDNDIEYTIAISRLPQGGQTIVNGTRHLDQLQDDVAYLRGILLGWINLDSTTDGNEQVTNTGRNAVWRDIRTLVLDRVFGVLPANTSPEAEATRRFMDPTYPGARNADNNASLSTAADDLKSLAFLGRLEEAIGSPDGWDAARHEGGVFFSDATGSNYLACNDSHCDPNETTAAGTVEKDLEGGLAAFSRRAERLFVGFDTTEFTRFGFWRREYTNFAARGEYDRDNNTDGDVTSRNNGFAFSPLAAAAYADSSDPMYPTGTARYKGKTIANQDNVPWLGDVDVTVHWDAALLTGSTATLVISNLTNPDGLPLERGGTGVREIVFLGGTAGTGAAIQQNADRVLSFVSSRVRVTYLDPFTGFDDISAGATANGHFVGKGLDGPWAVIGTWQLPGGIAGVGTNHVLVGGYGADLVAGP